MKDSLFLAIQYLKFHRIRSAVLISSISIILFLPNGLKKLVTESERLMLDRANSTPLIIGKKGSPTDLVINTLYFQQEKIDPLRMEKVYELNEAGFGHCIPIFSAFEARNYPIVGTDLDYFEFREIRIEEGRFMSILGECVIGSNVAKSLNLTAGDSLISSPASLFDFAGVYPLKMNITGVLAPTESPDDNAIFTDLKTTWVIMGLGHGHQDLQLINDPTIVLSRSDSVVTAGAKLFMYNEISDQNMESFHFHGNKSEYPITSIIFVPEDAKSETILRGRFEAGEILDQAVVPSFVVENLFSNIFKMQQVFDSVFIAVGFATALIFALIVTLGIRLRQAEIHTMFTIGSSRTKVFEVIFFELLMMIGISGVIALIMYKLTDLYVQDFIYRFII